jgi:acetyl-CoA acetyltransferase
MGALSDQVCIVGVGGTAFMKASNRTTLSMSCEAIKNAMDDAGLSPRRGRLSGQRLGPQ